VGAPCANTVKQPRGNPTVTSHTFARPAVCPELERVSIKRTPLLAWIRDRNGMRSTGLGPNAGRGCSRLSRLRALLGRPEPILALLWQISKPSLVLRGASWAVFGPSWRNVGSPSGYSWVPSVDKERGSREPAPLPERLLRAARDVQGQHGK